MKFKIDRERRDLIRFWMPWLLGSLALVAFCWRFTGQLPPRRLGMAAGDRSGAYYAYVEAYAKVFSENGVVLEPRETAGSIENYRLLQDSASGIQTAIVQGGTKPDGTKGLLAIASVFLEPIWIFVRSETPVTHIKELAGRRISIGVPGSGTWALAAQLLEASGVRAGGKTEFVELEIQKSVAALKTGAIDAAFFVSATNVPYLKDLLCAPGVRLMDFRMAESYSRVFSFLRPILLPQGTLDLEANLPAEDVHLVAPVASMVVHKDLHPAIILLLLEAAQDVHGAEGLLADPGTFPNVHFTEFPIDEAARDYFRSGPPFVQRYLPFWVAAWINRLKILIIPLIAILFPLFKLAPPIYRWRIRRKIYRWYEDLKAMDRLSGEPAGERDVLERLAELEKEITAVNVPLSYMEEYYHLRVHADLIRRGIEKRQKL